MLFKSPLNSVPFISNQLLTPYENDFCCETASEMKFKCGYFVQPYLLAVDDVMLMQVFCIQSASKQNGLIVAAERLV